MLGPALFTDLYELTMAQAYFADGIRDRAVFELAFRELPRNRNFIVTAGFADVVEFLTNYRFTEEDVEYLRDLREFSEKFLTFVSTLRFTGDVYALPEGSLVFPNEPILQVIAPVIEAQLVETLVLNQVHFQSLVATKACRVVQAARGSAVIDFGSRRAHGTDAGLKVARSTYLAGGRGTSNVLAGATYGIPTFGTMAHSYIQAHEDEAEALEKFSALYPETTLLVDTYDTLAGIAKVIELNKKSGKSFRVKAVRLDSGDLGALAVAARKMLDEAGLQTVRIFASSGLDEYRVQELVNAGVPIDAFGVGTKMAVIADAPELDMAYKMVEYAGKGRVKLSTRKLVYPGRKQVFRRLVDGKMVEDMIGRFDEALPGEKLLRPLMIAGKPVCQVDLEASRKHLASQLQLLPNHLLSLASAQPEYPVRFSERLQNDLERIRKQLKPVSLPA